MSLLLVDENLEQMPDLRIVQLLMDAMGKHDKVRLQTDTTDTCICRHCRWSMFATMAKYRG